jgi:hypothetical protein
MEECPVTKLKTLLIATAIAGLSGTLASAQQLASCGDMVLTLELDQIEYFDDGNEGTSSGDRRVGRFNTFFENGEPAGTYVFQSTVLPADGEGRFHEIGTSRYVFENGSIALSTLYTLANPSDTEHTVTAQFSYPVTGGTGAFAGVSGVVNTRAGADGDRTNAFTLECDD